MSCTNNNFILKQSMDKFHKQIDFSTVLFIVYFPSCNDLKIEIKKKKGTSVSLVTSRRFPGLPC